MSGQPFQPGAPQEAEVVLAAWRAELAVATDRERKAVIHYELGHAAELLGDEAAATDHYRAALEHKNDFRPPLFALLRGSTERKDTEGLVGLHTTEARAARKPAEEASALIDHALLLEERGERPGQARALLERALARDPGATAAALMLELHATRARDEALRRRSIEARAAHVHEPVLKRLLELEAALARSERGDAEGAIEILRTAMTVPTERWRYLRHLEALYRARGRTQELIETLERRAELAAARGRGDAVGQGLSGGSLPAFGDEERARDHASALLWDAARLRAPGDPQGARATLDRALALRPAEPLLRWERLDLLARMQDHAALQREARALAQQLGRGSHVAVLQARVAEAAHAAGDASARRSALETALADAPRSSTLRAQLAHALSQSGDAAEHARFLEEHLDGHEGRSRARRAWEAAELLGRAGQDRARARRLYAIAAEHAPDREAVLHEAYGWCMRSGGEGLAEAAGKLLDHTDDEVAREQLAHERFVALRGEPSEAARLLRETLAREGTPPWAAQAARLRGALTGDSELLSQAHARIAAESVDGETAAAHLCAAGRKHAREGRDGQAVEALREALVRAPAHPYALALLEEIERRRGDAGAIASLLFDAAAASTEERGSEVLLLRAARAATSAGRFDLATQALREAARRAPTSIAPAWELHRLGVARKDPALVAEGLTELAAREARTGGPGRAALAHAEHLAYVAADMESARRALLSALPDPVAGASAAIAVLLLPAGRTSAAEAAERLARDAHGLGGVQLRRLLAATLVDADASVERVEPVLARILETRPDERWARLAAVRAAGISPSRVGVRAEALLGLAHATTDPAACGELLVSALLTALVAGGEGGGVERQALDELEHAHAGDALCLLAADEGTDSPETRVAALRARLGAATDATRASLESALGRALSLAGQAKEATEALERAVRRDPEDLAAWEHLMTAARVTKRWELYAEACERLAANLEGDERVQLLEEAGNLYAERLDRAPAAVRALRRVIELDPTRVEAAARLRRLLEGSHDARGLLTLVDGRIGATDDPEELLALYWEKARHHLRLGEPAPAIEALGNVHVLEPTHAPALALLAEAYVGLERWSEAVQALRSLASLDVGAAARKTARFAAARYLKERLGDPRGAFEELRLIEDMGFADEALLSRMAHLAEEAGQLDAAVAALQRAASVTQGADRARYERRAGELLAGPLADSAGAIEALRRALEAAPGDLLAAETLAELLDRPARRRLADAFRDAVAAELALDPTDPNTLRKLLRSAQWSGEADFETMVLLSLDVLGHATGPERERLDALAQTARTEVEGELGDEALASIASVAPSEPLAKLARACAQAVGVVAGQGLEAHGVSKRDLIGPGRASARRDALAPIASAVGVEAERVYEGTRVAGEVALVAEDDAHAWVVDRSFSATEPRARLQAGMLALCARTGTHALLQAGWERAPTLLAAAARAADVELGGAADVSAAVPALKRALTRKARKAVAAAAREAGDGADLAEFCRRAQRGALRVGLLLSGDLERALALAAGEAPSSTTVRESPAAADLLRFWLSASARESRRDLGLGACDPVTEPDDLDAAASRLERASGFFGIVAPPTHWEVSVEDLVRALVPADPPGDAAATPVERADTTGTLARPDRGRMLERLAAGASPRVRARLLLSAAELCRAAAEPDRARELERRAWEHDRDDVCCVRAVRRDAARRGAFRDVSDTLAAEAALPIGGEERALVGLYGSIVRLLRLGDPSNAARDAERALAARPGSAILALHAADTQLLLGHEEQAYDGYERAARAWQDDRAAAALLREVGRAKEADGDLTRARFLYRKAVSLDGDALDAHVGLARTALAQRAFDECVEALAGAARATQDATLGETFLRASARVLHLQAGRPAQAAALLADATESPSTDARVEAAEAAGDRQGLAEALDAWAASTRRTTRAIALIRRAELFAEGADWASAAASLREAAHADQTMALVRVASEHVARRSGDARQLARVTLAEGAGPLTAAARVTLRSDARSDEERLLSEAASGELEHAGCAAVIGIDIAAEHRDEARVRALVRAELERGGETRLGLAVALADLEAERGDAKEAARIYRDLRRLRPDSVIALRRLAALTADVPVKAAALWLQEGAQASGPRAAFASMMAARLLEEAKADPRPALEQALAASPDYLPALVTMAELARAEGDADAAVRALRTRAEAEHDPAERATLLVQAALTASELDRAALEAAHALDPDDRVLADLRLRRDASLTPLDRARLLERMCEDAPSGWARVLRVSAACILETASELASAAESCRSAEEIEGRDELVTYLLDRLEPAAGQLDRAVERLDRAARDARDHTTRALALERMAELEQRSGHAALAVAPLEAILEHFPGHVASLRALERLAMQLDDDARLADVEQRLANAGSPHDSGAHARLCCRLRRRNSKDAGAADDVLRATFDYGQPDLWLALQVEGVARRARDQKLLSQALIEIAEHLEAPLEHLAAELRAAEALAPVKGSGVAANRLARAMAGGARYPLATEQLAWLREASGAAPKAAEAFEEAAREAKAPTRKALLFSHAGTLFLEQAMDPGRAAAAFLASAEAELDLAVVERLRPLVPAHCDPKKLSALLSARLVRGGDREELFELSLVHAELAHELGDGPGRRKSLRAAATLAPGRIDVLEQLFQACREDGDVRGAIEALQRTAGTTQDPRILRNVQLRLADVHATAGDLGRARGALLKALELHPEDAEVHKRLEALERRRH